MNIKSTAFVGVLFTIIVPANLIAEAKHRPCVEDEERYKKRSAEIQMLMTLDQKDRSTNIVTPEVQKRDLERRKRIGAIFGEGCFKSSADYANAALVFQHGDHPDHFFQTFIWAKRAVELGDPSQKRMMALAIDRYLVNIGHKQLFASQAFKEGNSPCWCLQELEGTFLENVRIDYMGSSLKDQESWVDELNKGTECRKRNYCRQGLLDTPKGFIPGFW